MWIFSTRLCPVVQKPIDPAEGRGGKTGGSSKRPGMPKSENHFASAGRSVDRSFYIYSRQTGEYLHSRDQGENQDDERTGRCTQRILKGQRLTNYGYKFILNMFCIFVPITWGWRAKFVRFVLHHKVNVLEAFRFNPVAFLRGLEFAQLPWRWLGWL